MNRPPRNVDHLLHVFFNTMDQQMAILERSHGELIFSTCNQSLAKLLGLPADRLAGRPLKDFTELDDRLARWLKHHGSSPTSPPVFTSECRLRSESPPVWVEYRISPIANHAPEPAFYGLIATDITQRKKAQEELGLVKDRLTDIIDLGTGKLDIIIESLQIIINKIPVMICCYDTSASVLFVNRAFSGLVGWSLAEARGLDIMEACYPDPDLRRRIREFMMNGNAEWRDFPMHCRNGRVLETSWTNVPLTQRIHIGLGIDITQRKNAEDAVRRLSRNTLEMLERDRQSVAKELHDSIGASLAAIKFSLEGRVYDMEDDSLSLQTIISHLADTIKESKRISNGLRPLTLDDLGLLPTLTAYVRNLNDVHPDIGISLSLDIEEGDLPDALKIVLYRVAQEALNNAMKHSGADRASVTLRKVPAGIEFIIEDNGCGFDVEEAFARSDPLSGYGLRSMRERVEICDGIFRIRTLQGSGTIVSATFAVA